MADSHITNSIVIPANAGIQFDVISCLVPLFAYQAKIKMDPGVRRDDDVCFFVGGS